MGGALYSKPWRTVPTTNCENLHFVKSYRTESDEVNHLRILLHGPVGAGKSSFINSVDSLLQDRDAGRALPDANSGKSFTSVYRTYKFRKAKQSYYSFVFNDIMGFEKHKNSGVHEDDVILALRGHVKDNYKFIPGRPLTATDPYYNPSPTLEDKVHALVFVIPASSVTLLSDEVAHKMREVRLAAAEMGIPQLAILTKVDEACPNAKQDLMNVYRSKLLKEKVEQLSQALGLPENCIFLVKNYESEINKEKIHMLILRALRQIITYGDDFLNDQ